jgi:hypothetical protein
MVFLGRKNKALDAQAVEQGSCRSNGEDFKEIPEQAPFKSASSEESLVSPLADYKFGIAERLQETVAVKAASSQVKRSPDLVPLSKQFDALRRRLRQMIATSKKYHESMLALDKDRMQVRRRFSVLVLPAPVHPQVCHQKISCGSFVRI